MKIPVFGLLFGLLLTACSAAAPEATATPSATSVPTSAPSATATQTPLPSETAIPLSAVCSPLQDHSLDSLPDYLTQPLIRPQGSNLETGHHGVDFAYYRRDGVGGHINGTPLQSVLDSFVAGFGSNPVYGNYLILESPHERLPAGLAELYEMMPGESLYLLYAHMQEPFAQSIGDFISCGTVVGNVGESGDQYFVSDPHLHLETRSGPAGIQFAPMSFYSTQASEEEIAEYHFWRVSETFSLLDPMLLLSLEQ